MKKHTQFTVLGKPFFSIGAQLHNSSAYALGSVGGEKYEQDCRRTFDSLKALNVNTAAVPVCWDAFEPEEGKYDFDHVRRIIDRIREHGLHAVLLWFGTWKNGQMEYTPAWVKRDRKRFKRALCKDGTETAALSPFYEANKEQDKKAFCKLMECIREYDETTGTVIAVQIENEPGMYAASIRDFSEEGTKAFLGAVPEKMIALAREDQGEIGKAWRENGAKLEGSWAELFGTFGAELCNAWAISGYINEIAGAGREIYDLFLYVNVWMDRNGERGWSLAGLDYPSGGPVSKVLPVWLCQGTNLDAVAPDIYEIEPELVRKAQNTYDREGWAFYVPESGQTQVNAAMMFDAVGKHGAIGYHVFAAESALDEEGKLVENAVGIRHSFIMLRNAEDLLAKYGGSDCIYTLTQGVGQDADRLKIGDRICRVCYTGAAMEYAGWVAMDYRHGKDLININHIPMSLD